MVSQSFWNHKRHSSFFRCDFVFSSRLQQMWCLHRHPHKLHLWSLLNSFRIRSQKNSMVITSLFGVNKSSRFFAVISITTSALHNKFLHNTFLAQQLKYGPNLSNGPFSKTLSFHPNPNLLHLLSRSCAAQHNSFLISFFFCSSISLHPCPHRSFTYARKSTYCRRPHKDPQEGLTKRGWSRKAENIPLLQVCEKSAAPTLSRSSLPRRLRHLICWFLPRVTTVVCLKRMRVYDLTI